MKKWKRWLVLALATVLCLSLCGCDELETMRSEHGVWQEDGSILWNGAVYRKLENTLSMGEFDFTYSYVTIYVTEPDVPVLLSTMFGEAMDVSADGTILEHYDYRLVEERTTWYCREDVYDEMVKKLENGVTLNTYCYYYWDFDRGKNVPYYLTEEQANTMHRILATVDPVLSADFDEPIEDELYLYVTDENRMFEQGTDKWLCITQSRYCIESFDEIYVVPMEYNAIFDEIWKAYDDRMHVRDYPPSMVI